MSLELVPAGEPEPLSLEDRRDRIIASLERAALDIGGELLAAKREHPREFIQWVTENLPFGIDKADKLMAITRAFHNASEDVRAALPSAWSTLYELSRIPKAELVAAVESGAVNPDMTREAAKIIHRGKTPGPGVTPVLTADIVCRELVRFHRDDLSDDVRGLLDRWLIDERATRTWPHGSKSDGVGTPTTPPS